MMQRRILIMTLDSEAVFSARAATLGSHHGLPYIPGAALLGYAAARLYSKITSKEAYNAFHSGSVRFSNGFPLLSSGEIAFPAPACLRKQKDASIPAGPDGSIDGGKLRILPGGEFILDDGRKAQSEAYRPGYLTLSSREHQTSMGSRMMTAIENDKNRAASEQLFSFQYVAEAAKFAASIEVDVDDDVDPKISETIFKIFDSGRLNLGRSGGTGFGGEIGVEILPDSAGRVWPDNLGVTGTKLTLWLLSDLAVNDPRTGLPSLAPRPEWLGLPEGTLIPDASFMTFRRYAPYNRYLDTADQERCVIEQGSVLRFELKEPDRFNPGVLDRGLGLYCEVGLGRVCANPTFLNGTVPKFIDTPCRLSVPAKLETHVAKSMAYAENEYASSIQIWAEARVSEKKYNLEDDAFLLNSLEELRKWYVEYRTNQADDGAGPTSAQWNHVSSGDLKKFAQGNESDIVAWLTTKASDTLWNNNEPRKRAFLKKLANGGRRIAGGAQ